MISSMHEYLARARAAAAEKAKSQEEERPSSAEDVAAAAGAVADTPRPKPKLAQRSTQAATSTATAKRAVTPIFVDDDSTPTPSSAESTPRSSSGSGATGFTVLGEQEHMKTRLTMYLGAIETMCKRQLFGWMPDLLAAAKMKYAAPVSYIRAFGGRPYERIPEEIIGQLSTILDTAETKKKMHGKKRARGSGEGEEAVEEDASVEPAVESAAVAVESAATVEPAAVVVEPAVEPVHELELEEEESEEGQEEEEEEEEEPEAKRKRGRPRKDGEEKKKKQKRESKKQTAAAATARHKKQKDADSEEVQLSDLSGAACMPVYFLRYPSALLHAIREVISNPFDARAEGRPVTRIWYDVDPKTGWVSVVNDGSYIELEPYVISEDMIQRASADDLHRIRAYEGRIIARIAVETNYAGSKFSKQDDESVARAGRNGLGLKIVNAVSHAFEIFVWDGKGRAYTARWEDHIKHLKYEKLTEYEMPEDDVEGADDDGADESVSEQKKRGKKKTLGPVKGSPPPWVGAPAFSSYIPAPTLDLPLPKLLPGKPFFGVRFLPDYLNLGVDRALNPVAVVHRTDRPRFSEPDMQEAVERYEQTGVNSDADEDEDEGEGEKKMHPLLVAAMESVAWETVAGCGCAGAVRVMVRGRTLPFRSPADMLASIVWTNRGERKPRILSHTFEFPGGNRVSFSIALAPPVVARPDGNYGPGSDRVAIGIVNSQRCDSGSHMDYVINAISHAIRTNVTKKKGSASLSHLVSAPRIQGLFAIVVEAHVRNPTYSDQTKATLHSRISGGLARFSDSSSPILPEAMQAFVTAATMNKLVEDAEAIETADLKKAARANARVLQTTLANGQLRRTVHVPKYSHAALAGVPGKSLGCTLILTEGDSAKGLAMSGLEALDADTRRTFGVFPLKGNAITARRASMRDLLENDEAKHLAAILGLIIGQDYSKPGALERALNYGRVMIFSDQDSDGHKIAASVVDLMDCMFSDGTKAGGFVRLASAISPFKSFVWRFATPIVRGSSSSSSKSSAPATLKFMTESAFSTWKDAHPDEVGRYSWKYYKGLGTSSNTEAKEYFRNIGTCAFALEHGGAVSDRIMAVMFDSRLVAHRKALAMYPHALRELDWTSGAVPVHSYVLQTAMAYLRKFLHRHMPGIDGFKRSQRQVLSGALMLPRYKGTLRALETRGSAGAVKVSQIVPAISSEVSYHHGEAAMFGTLIGMAQVFAGTQQIPLFSAEGQFGSRIGGPSEASDPRYIFTRLLDDVAQAVLNTDEMPVLHRCLVDERVAEPICFAPPIPGPLINGCDGIATGWSTAIPPFRVRDLIALTRRYIAILRAAGGEVYISRSDRPPAPPMHVEESQIVAIDRQSYRAAVEASIEEVELKIRKKTTSTAADASAGADYHEKLMQALRTLRAHASEAGDEEDDDSSSSSSSSSFRELEFEHARRSLTDRAEVKEELSVWSREVEDTLVPWWDLHAGEVVKTEKGGFCALGRYSVDLEEARVTITELPPGVWTEPFVTEIREKFVIRSRALAYSTAAASLDKGGETKAEDDIKKQKKREDRAFIKDLDVDKAATYASITLHCARDRLQPLLEGAIEHTPSRRNESAVEELRVALTKAGLDPETTQVFRNVRESFSGSAASWTRYPLLEKVLGLAKPISISNMQIFDAHHRLRHMRTLADFWEPCADAKLSAILAKLRSRYYELDLQARRLAEQARFATAIAIDRTLDIRNMPRADLEAYLRAERYATDQQLRDGAEATEEIDQEEETAAAADTWSYLRLDLMSITKERVEKLLRSVREAEAERDALLKRSIYDVWTEELDALEGKIAELAVYKIRTVFGANA
jgi:DNA gyrase/topoisomerase IV subunit B